MNKRAIHTDILLAFPELEAAFRVSALAANGLTELALRVVIDTSEPSVDAMSLEKDVGAVGLCHINGLLNGQVLVAGNRDGGVKDIMARGTLVHELLRFVV